MVQKVNRKSSKENILHNEIDRLLEVSLTSEIRNSVLISTDKQKNKLLKAELEKRSSDFKNIQANLLNRIKILENDFKRSQAQIIDFELKLQHQKEKMACDVYWKSKLSTINDENVLLKTQLDELIEHVNQKTYAYADVHPQNQDLLITISELKNKLQTVDKRKNVNTKFEKSETLGTLLCVMPLPKNIAVKAKKVNSSVKRALFTTPTAKSKNLGATYVVVKSRLSVAKTPATTNKVIQLVPLDFSLQEDHFATNSLDMEIMVQGNLRYVHNLEGDDLLIDSRDSNLYTIPISEMVASSLVCLMSKATSIKSWLWHHMLSHLNFGTINQLTSNDLIDGLLKFKYNKDHLCSACEKAEQVATEPNSPVLNANADEYVQEDVADFDENVFYTAPPTPVFKEAESSLAYPDPSNMHEFHQKHRLSDRWTKNHPIEQVTCDPSKPVMTRNQLQTDAEVCMYALTVRIIEPKNIKETMLDASWIESMQDELNQFKCLDVWELVECPIGRNIIAVKWI
ncbi:gag-pol polyprotein [Tanacetum coccineum]